jgi:hypothetical protein
MASPRESRAPLRDDRETFKWRDARSPTAGSMPRPREPALHRRTHPPRVASPYARRPPFKKQGRAAGRESRAALPLVSPLHQGVRGGLSHRWGLCPPTQPTPPNRAGARRATTLSPRRCDPQAQPTHRPSSPRKRGSTAPHPRPPVPATTLSPAPPRRRPGPILRSLPSTSGCGLIRGWPPASAGEGRRWWIVRSPPENLAAAPPAAICRPAPPTGRHPRESGDPWRTPATFSASHHPLPRPSPAEAGAHPRVSGLQNAVAGVAGPRAPNALAKWAHEATLGARGNICPSS